MVKLQFTKRSILQNADNFAKFSITYARLGSQRACKTQMKSWKTTNFYETQLEKKKRHH